jgi:hypothetical protein
MTKEIKKKSIGVIDLLIDCWDINLKRQIFRAYSVPEQVQ